MAEIRSSTVKNWYLRLEYSSTQSIADNTSTVTMNLYVYHGYTSYNNGSNSAYYMINGTKTFTTYNYSGAGEALLGTKTQVVNHNDDGTGSIKLSAFFSSGHSGSTYTPDSLTISEQTITLPTIPRASTITKTNLNNTTNYINKSLTISWTASSTAFTHTLKYKMAGQSAETAIASNIAAGTTSKAWTVPTSFYALCPNAQSLAGTLYLYTYSGSTQIGEVNTASFTVYVEEAVNKPTISVTLTDTNTTTSALTGSNSKIIKGYSNMKVVCAGTAKNSASISTNSITYNGSTTTVTTASQTKTFSAVATGTFKGIVTDSRGFTATTTPSTTLINYYKPTVTIAVEMSITSTTNNDAKADLTIETKAWSGSFGAVSNSITVKYRYRESGGTWSSYTTVTTSSGSTYTASKTELDGTKTYEFQAQLVDKLETVTSNEVSASALPVFDFDRDDFNFNVPVNAKGFTVNDNPVVKYAGYDYTIPANSDLNSEEFTKAGCYRCSSTANARTISHTPWGTSPSTGAVAFMMNTYYSLGHETNQGTYRYVRQEFRAYNSTLVYARFVQTAATAGVWTYGAWYLISGYMADRVTERGTSGDWHYRKWVNGDYECWGNIDITFNSNPTTGIGITNFYLDYVDVDLPVTLTENAVATCSCQWYSTEWVQCQGYKDKIRVRRMGIAGSFANCPTLTVSIQVKGRWK